jgi:hypothetical protein
MHGHMNVKFVTDSQHGYLRYKIGIQYINQQYGLCKTNKTQIIKQTSSLMPTPTCFGTELPSSGILMAIKAISSSNTYVISFCY